MEIFDRSKGRAWSVEAENLDELDRALARCDGLESLSSIIATIDAEHQEAIAEILEGLLDHGALIDQNRRARELFQQLHGRGLAPVAEVADIVAMPRWTDERATASPSHLGEKGRLERDRSLNVAALIETATTLRVDPGVLAQLLTDAYGSIGNWKPVPSAGRLWPLVIHVVQGDPVEVRWFDDDRASLSHPLPGIETDAHAVAQCFVDSVLTSGYIMRGGSLIVVSADVTRSERKYGNRSLYYALIECGAVLQNVVSAGRSMGLSTRPIGGFWPSRLAEIMDYDLLPLITVMVVPKSVP